MQWWVLETIIHMIVLPYNKYFKDINECDEGKDDCSSNATCHNAAGSYTCTCVYGYSGDGYNCTSKKCFSEP